MKLPGKAIVWLIYFDASVTRRLGRRVPRKLAIEAPTLEELVEACKRLNLSFQVRESARYPRMWWGRRGYVIVDKPKSKGRLLEALALELKRLRSEKGMYGGGLEKT
jgi:signal recognition particle subunit SRP19